MGVPGDHFTTALDGPVNASRAIDEAWDTVAALSEPDAESLPGVCNEGDVAADALSSGLPARLEVAPLGATRGVAVSVRVPASCANNPRLRVGSFGAVQGLERPYRANLSSLAKDGAFRVAVDASAQGQERLSVSAGPHDGSCSASRGALATVELVDNAFGGTARRVAGVPRVHIALEQDSAQPHCAGAPNPKLRRLGDFDGDGRADVLLRHADGHWLYYPMDGARAATDGGVAANLPGNPAIAVAGVGDFNGDGRDDVLMRMGSGTWRYYPMDGPRPVAGRGKVALPTDLAWRLEGIGDFDGDGKDDVLMRRRGARLARLDAESPLQTVDEWRYYPMDGKRVLEGGTPAGLHHNFGDWVGGVGDFNGDGRDDVLFRLSDGSWHYLPFHGGIGGETSALPGEGAVALPEDMAWAVAGIADFNGDGKDDVLLRHEDGRWRYQPMDGANLLGGGDAADLPADRTVWLAGVGDMDGDGRADVLTRRGYGAWRYHYVDAATGSFTSGGDVALASGTAWGVLKGGLEAPPRILATLPDQPLALGGDTALDLSLHFSGGQTLVLEVESSDGDVVRASVAGNMLTLAPVADGRATVTVTARDADGYAVSQTFQAVVSESGRVGRRFQDCPECPEMVVVPAGSFTMGSPPEEEGGPGSDQGYERPQLQVEFAAPFAIGVFEVTFAQWDACAADGDCADLPRHAPFDEPNHPVHNVSWNDAQAYVAWLSAKTGQAYRLPSDAEWEYATRAGTTTPFHFGETITTAQANYDGEVPSPRRGEGEEASPHARANPGAYRGGPVPVGFLPANPWGLHEVHGNVREWTQDCFAASNLRGWPADGSAVETGDCDSRFLRNGSYYDDPGDVRSANRAPSSAGERHGSAGFRVAKTLGE